MKLRDPARIPEVLRLLEQAWLKQPHLRLGQLLLNHTPLASPCPELFYVEDDVLLRRLGIQDPPSVRLAEQSSPES